MSFPIRLQKSLFVTEMKSLMLKEYVCEVSEMFAYL